MQKNKINMHIFSNERVINIYGLHTSINKLDTSMQPKEQWLKYLQEAKEIDTLHAKWQAKIDKGTKVILMIVTFHLIDGGFALDRYLLPFEHKLMKSEMKEWSKYAFVERIDSEEIPFISFDQL